MKHLLNILKSGKIIYNDYGNSLNFRTLRMKLKLERITKQNNEFSKGELHNVYKICTYMQEISFP